MPPISAPSKPPNIQRPHNHRSDRNMSKLSQKCQVFLGGSCNPTTWRQDVAIPMLTKHGISYYNPQVAHWEEALIAVEDQAKNDAAILFYVFDPTTRNVAAMVEVAYLAGCCKRLIAVFGSYSGPGQHINGEPISQTEYEELSGSLLMVQDLMERQGIPVFTQLTHALSCTTKMLRESLRPQDLGFGDTIKYAHTSLGDKLMKLHDAFVNINCNIINVDDANLIFKVVANREFTKEEQQAIISSKKEATQQALSPTELPLNDVRLTFQEFCCLASQFENQPLESRNVWNLLSRSVVSPLQKLVDWVPPASNTPGSARDVYLGGPTGARVLWRENLAFPTLKKNGLTYFTPSMGGGLERLLPMEDAHIEKCRVLLFVIPNNARSLSQMALVSYYISLRCNVVLCVQMLAQGTSFQAEELSGLAIKDYNRGRSYLIDEATKEGVPVFYEVGEALNCVVQKCKANR